jgi:ketosteroid isomerase-like protein
MKKALLLLILGAAAWYYLVEGRKVKESHVRALYDHYWAAVDDNDSDAVCKMFDDKFSSVVRTRTPAGPVEERGTKQTACEGTEKFFELKKKMEERSGQTLYVNTEYTVDSITVNADGKSATARMVSEVRIGTEQRAFLTMRETQTDTIIRRYGRARFLDSDGEISL